MIPNFNKVELDSHPIMILGVPIDNLTIFEALHNAMQLLENTTPDYLCTVNSDFIVNALSWNPSSIRHPELFEIMRKGKINIADGMPLIWLSQLLGCPLKERIAGADFIPKFIEQCYKQQKKIFLLGGDYNVAEKAFQCLLQQHPGIKIVGFASPQVHIKGEELAEASLQDASIIQDIQQAAPDLLLLFFGNPKQEIWFQRIRPHIQVPLVIGGGGTLNFIVGEIKRAPQWMQQKGFEWLYRLYTEPSRLWKRYLYDFVKLLYVSIPLLVIHSYCKLFSRKTGSIDSQTFNHQILKLPSYVEGKILRKYVFKQTDLVILDFQFVTFLDAEFLGWLSRLPCKTYLINVSSRIRTLMRYHRAWISLSPFVFESLEACVAHLNTLQPMVPFSVSIVPLENGVEATFFGRLDALHATEAQFSKLSALFNQKHVLMNMQHCSFIDSSGIGFLLRLLKAAKKQHRLFYLCNLTSTVQQALKITQVDQLFPMATKEEVLHAFKTQKKQDMQDI